MFSASRFPKSRTQISIGISLVHYTHFLHIMYPLLVWEPDSGVCVKQFLSNPTVLVETPMLLKVSYDFLEKETHLIIQEIKLGSLLSFVTMKEHNTIFLKMTVGIFLHFFSAPFRGQLSCSPSFFSCCYWQQAFFSATRAARCEFVQAWSDTQEIIRLPVDIAKNDIFKKCL